MSIKLSLEYTW